MDKEKQLELKALCPNLYKILLQDNCTAPFHCISAFGFECGNGWYELIKELSIGLEKIIVELPEASREHLYAVQVKEKFGTLRFYMSGETDPMYELIKKAEQKSSVTCEVTGKKGKTYNSNGWLVTLCKEELEKYEEARKLSRQPTGSVPNIETD